MTRVSDLPGDPLVRPECSVGDLPNDVEHTVAEIRNPVEVETVIEARPPTSEVIAYGIDNAPETQTVLDRNDALPPRLALKFALDVQVRREPHGAEARPALRDEEAAYLCVEGDVRENGGARLA